MAEGKSPVERVVVVSSKRENTKTGVSLVQPADTYAADAFAGQSRERISQDDVAREVFTEVDCNIVRLAHLISGICSRMGAPL